MRKDKFAIIGAGHFGSAIATALSQKGAEVLVIDSEISLVQEMSEDVAYAVCIDATSKRALQAENIEEFDTVVIAIGNDFQARLLCAANLLDLNIKRIICRTMGKSQRIILEKMGISEFLSPEDEIGAIFAERLMNPSIINSLQLPDEYKIVEVKTPSSIVGVTVGDLAFRDTYRLSLITILRQFEDMVDGVINSVEHLIGVPDNTEIIRDNDIFVFFGQSKDIDHFIDAHQ